MRRRPKRHCTAQPMPRAAFIVRFLRMLILRSTDGRRHPRLSYGKRDKNCALIMSEVFSKEKFIKELVDELHEVRTKWREIGTQLEIPQETLKNIGRQNDDSGLAFTEMIDEWIKRMKDREPSWVDIVRVLESRSVDERRLARNLRQRRTTDSADDFTTPGH